MSTIWTVDLERGTLTSSDGYTFKVTAIGNELVFTCVGHPLIPANDIVDYIESARAEAVEAYKKR